MENETTSWIKVHGATPGSQEKWKGLFWIHFDTANFAKLCSIQAKVHIQHTIMVVFICLFTLDKFVAFLLLQTN